MIGVDCQTKILLQPIKRQTIFFNPICSQIIFVIQSEAESLHPMRSLELRSILYCITSLPNLLSSKQLRRLSKNPCGVCEEVG